MIADTLNNIGIYKDISPDIYEGLKFLKNVTPDIEYGTFQLSERVKVMVTNYDTKEFNPLGFEAHIKNIDIQYPIYGRERIYWLPIQQVNSRVPYDKEKDIAFYDAKEGKSSFVDIGCGLFAIFFPDDAHSPQYAVNGIENIKKITLKIKNQL